MDVTPSGDAVVTYRRRADELPKSLAATAVLTLTAKVATDGVPPAEAKAFRAINRLPAALEPVLWPPMQIGSLWGPFIAGAVAWWRWRSWRAAVGSVVAGVVSWQLAKLIKNFIQRGRPLDEIDDVVRRMGTPKDGLGFVSGHSAVVFSVVTVLSPHVNRPTRVALYALAGVVAVARIHVGAHLPIDTVGGAAMGVLVGQAWRTAVGDPVTDAGAAPAVADG